MAAQVKQEWAANKSSMTNKDMLGLIGEFLSDVKFDDPTDMDMLAVEKIVKVLANGSTQNVTAMEQVVTAAQTGAKGWKDYATKLENFQAGQVKLSDIVGNALDADKPH
eukprot:TRINITY_DN65935_c7_g1_i1.p2 TRINITY_DN65935_c7_g1~~TRINITY_DN65935_c7_g1_i1.p2  ORF type:complete len:109 (+),score=20.59 TRINITY_DN65935_c7_g1_i1:297-623(+)